MQILPIDAILPELTVALSAGTRAVLQAPPGAGKTTKVPLALVDADWLAGQRILVLEPRRLAAHAAARRMAELLGENVGETVGYRIRFERKVSRKTRIEVITEGILTRMVQADPALEGVGMVIFDEFHERSLHADLGLALCLEAQQVFRDDLRLLVMSATLDGERIAALLDDAPLITSEGRQYPVATHYADSRVDGRIEDAVARAVRRALHEEPGDVLVFLPGAGEIRRTAERLDPATLPGTVQVYPLYGQLSQAMQRAALAPSPAGERKVVLATSIAETSLTIGGVRVVIDSGLVRGPEFAPATGMTRLMTGANSQASADQRRGRAGRLGPGVCYRLWPAYDHAHRPEHPSPELLQADLAPLALELAQWGTDASELAWLDPPPEAALTQANELLTQLGALDAEGHITRHGRQMVRLGAHPRLAHLLLRGEALSLGTLACDVAALVSERDVLRNSHGPADPDLRLRLDVLQQHRTGTRRQQHHGLQVDRRAMRQALDLSKQWQRRLRLREQPDYDANLAGVLLAFAYPDRIGQREAEGRFRLRTGHRVVLRDAPLLAATDYLVAAHLDGERHLGRVFLAAPLTLDDLTTHFAGAIETHDAVIWDVAAERVTAERSTTLGALVLQTAPLAKPSPDAVHEAVLDGIRQMGLGVLTWTRDLTAWRQRVQFLHRHNPTAWPDLADDTLLATLDDWLGPYLTPTHKRRDDLKRLDLTRILHALLPWPQRQALDREAPTHVQVPSGSRIRLDYSDPDAPVLAVRLQEVFGLLETPRIAGGRVPLTVHLLSPARRPVQVTQDLASFWATTYFDVRKDLRGRYSKHYWPEDPLTATATRRTKPRK
ncbi:MAG: ATP-dependent helicase HrpB [Bacteroidota bacterium]